MYEELLIGLRGHAKRLGCDDRCPCYDAENRGYATCSEELAEKAADAIEELQQTVEHYKGCADDWYKEACEYKVMLHRWIPVTERLPKYGDWVLGIGPKKGYHVCEYRGITHFPYSGDSPWFSAKGRSLTITHWQPLPEPPKEEAE